jgi:hypothetical protein
MSFPDERKTLAKSFNDKARRTLVTKNRVIIPHKVKPNGTVITDDNFNVKVDISQLNLKELRFLDVFREMGWDFERACEKMCIEPIEGRKTYRKCLWFPQEDAYVKAKAKVPTPEYILAKDVDNVEGAEKLDDSQHKSLDRLAKITGSFKTSDSVSSTVNIFNLPKLTPEIEEKFKALAEQALEAEVVEAKVANG